MSFHPETQALKPTNDYRPNPLGLSLSKSRDFSLPWQGKTQPFDLHQANGLTMAAR